MSSVQPQPYRLTVEDVFRMSEVGVFHPEARIELIDGMLYELRPPGPEHGWTVSWLTRHFVRTTRELEVRIQDTLLIPGGFVLPDLSVIEPAARDKLPDTAELVIEVTFTTLRHDERKADLYAAADVTEYWLVHPDKRRIVVHRDPAPDGYRTRTTASDGDALQPRIAADPVDVSAVLGPRG